MGHQLLGSSSHSKPKPSQSVIIQQFRRDFTPPDGWTNDPEEMFPRETYQDPVSGGYGLLQSLGLKTVTPVMAHTRQNGGTLHIFASSGNFYLWNIVEGTVRRFQDKDFDKIL
ncbi:MAG: hypothetical protein LQ351_002951 [Letrouitia transgressa]|nr:MAG: hypothetical protein LQ351_002951 [Letrouitia transgressa]